MYKIDHADGIEWLRQMSSSIHAIVTDPPYGREFSSDQLDKLRAGRGGAWRQPQALGGVVRAPTPRFTDMSDSDRGDMTLMFTRFADAAIHALVPGGHVFVATNPIVSHLVYGAMMSRGFEKRGEVVRLVQTLRGGDRPKGAEQEFSDVTVMPRSAWEPWGVFRKPLVPGATVAQNLRVWHAGALRRESFARPFTDVIRSKPAGKIERVIAPHPSLKPQAFMRQIVRASLPLGRGIVVDPFMGSGSTIAAAEACGYKSHGIERDKEFFEMAKRAIDQLAKLWTPQ